MNGEPQDRVIRVFISSTFRDMHEERNELVKRVFPELRRLCESRGVVWGEVDLRWGIPDERKAEGKVLPICLAEIKNCRPYFIGMLGERYGWVPREIADDLIQSEPWLAEHRERSVTELEILHGVLNDPSMAGQAFFYFRDPGYAEAGARGADGAFVEGPDPAEVAELGKAEAEARALARKEKLRALKERIRAAHREGKLPHAPRENYAGPGALAELVKRDLEAVIEASFPAGSELDPLARERADHEAFGKSRARVYVERPALFRALDEHAAGDGPPLVVLGESGGGKSALFANWVRRQRAAAKESNGGSNGGAREGAGAGAPGKAAPRVFVIEHYVGASAGSSDWAGMLRRVLGELDAHFALKLEIPDKPDALRLYFANALYRAAAKGRVILVLDGLNQLEDRDQAPDLVWLPPEVPGNVRLVLSTLPGRPLEALRERSWPTLNVELLSADEKRVLIPRYLRQYSRELGKAHLERLVAAPETASPLYLRTLLEELRQWGYHETLGERIDHYLEAKDPRELFTKVLERWEEDFERDRQHLVRDATTHLWASRRGLSEVELLGMLGAAAAPSITARTGSVQTAEGAWQPLPRAHWSPLYLAADASFVSRSGLIGFAHDYLRQAVETRYLASPDAQRAAHAEVADYFAGQALGPRQVDELPWQLARAEEWRKLYHLLAEPMFFEAAWEANQFEVKAHWVQIEAHSLFRIVDAYAKVLARGVGAAVATTIGILLGDTGHPEEALQIRARLVDQYRATRDLSGLQVCLGNQATILYARGELDEAMRLMKEQERICQQLGNLDSLGSCLGNQAVILQARGELDEAMRFMKEQERICQQLSNLDSLQRSLGNQAVILQARGELDEAMRLHKEEERICRQLGNLDSLQGSLGNQGLILQARGQLDEAMGLYKEQERICRQLGNLNDLGACLGNQANILYARGQLDDAMRLHKEQERLCKELGNLDSLGACLGNQALILYARGQFDEAMRLHKEEEGICKQLGNLDSLQRSLGNQALILKARGQLDEAMALHKEKQRICKELGNLDGFQISLGNRALILYARGQLEEAMALHKEQERICKQLGNLDGFGRSLGNQALILEARGQLDEAMALHKEKQRICKELGNLDGLQISLGNQAGILYARGQLDQAMALYKEQERICKQLGNLDGLQTSLGNQAVVLQTRGQLDQAMALHKEQERICKKLGNPEGCARSLASQALVLREQGQLREALAHAEEALSVARDHGFAALDKQIQSIVDGIRRAPLANPSAAPRASGRAAAPSSRAIPPADNHRPLLEAHALLAQNRTADAITLLQPLQGRDLAIDNTLAVACLRSGDPNRAKTLLGRRVLGGGGIPHVLRNTPVELRVNYLIAVLLTEGDVEMCKDELQAMGDASPARLMLDAIARRDEQLGGWQRFKGFWGGRLPSVELPEPLGVLMTPGETPA